MLDESLVKIYSGLVTLRGNSCHLVKVKPKTTMNLKIALLIVTSPLLLWSCGDKDCIGGEGTITSQDFDVPQPFNSVISAGSFEVTISSGSEQAIQATGHPNILNLLVLDVSSGVLTVKLPNDCYNSFDLQVKITTPPLEEIILAGSGDLEIEGFNGGEEVAIELNGSGRVEGLGPITSTRKFSITSTGSGEMDLTIGSDQLEVEQSGSGRIILSGNVNLQTVTKTSSGSYQAFDLDSDICTIVNSGSGSAEITVSEELTATISGSGGIIYRGDPSVTQNVTGSGNITKAN